MSKRGNNVPSIDPEDDALDAVPACKNGINDICVSILNF